MKNPTQRNKGKGGRVETKKVRKGSRKRRLRGMGERKAVRGERKTDGSKSKRNATPNN